MIDETESLAQALLGHIRTLRLSGRNDGMVEDMESAAELLASSTTIELQSNTPLHKFINAAAGDGLVLDGVDAADLYMALYPELYKATCESIDINVDTQNG